MEGGGITFTGSAVLPYMAPDARDDLLAVASAQGGLELTSGYRTVVQQYLLYRWWQVGSCGITAAATPGTSNHETGRAVDVGNYGSYVSLMAAHGWSHDVAGDPVHFDHLGSPDQRGADVLAFQRLWNRNNPSDPIAEDGAYGPQTGARIAMAPAGGFAIGACPTAPPPPPPPDMPAWDANRAGNDLPAELASGAKVTVWFALKNTGTATWTPGETFLDTTQPMDRASALADPTWSAPSRAATIDHSTAPGEIGKFAFVIDAPQVGAPTMLTERFGLVDGTTWFGPSDLTISILVTPLTVTTADPMGATMGGCAVVHAASPGRLPTALLTLALLALVARRRA
jgi:hypothetical protein